jgi:hypothetical protein
MILPAGLLALGETPQVVAQDSRMSRPALSTELSTAIPATANSRKNMRLARLPRKVLEL